MARARSASPRQGDEEKVAAGVRPFWSGTVTFGLVSVPVELYAATKANRVRVRMLSPEGRPLRRRYVCSADGEVLDGADIVRGYDSKIGDAPGEHPRFVLVSDDELEALEPERTREIDLRRFVPVAQIDPLMCDRSYLLLPDGEVTKAYRLLAAAMEEGGRAALASFVMRGREYMVAIMAQAGLLRAETLRFASEIRSAEAVGLDAPKQARQGLVTRFRHAIGLSASEGLDGSELVDRRVMALRALVQRKAEKGKDLVYVEGSDQGHAAGALEDGEHEGDVADILELLRARMGVGKEGTTPRSVLNERSKAELVELARRRDLRGRSRMSKDELVRALSSA